MQPRCLDLYCGAGGATRGYQLAGFHVTGVDLVPQPRYCGDSFIQADALDYLARCGSNYDMIHASPPCQKYSPMSAVTGTEYVDLIPPTREELRNFGLPYVIENVPLAPIRRDLILCGTQFGLEVIRHRKFECGFDHNPFQLPPHACRNATITGAVVAFRNGGRVREGRTRPKRSGAREFADAMGCDWMTAHAARQAIPPAYTQFIGIKMLATLRKG